MTWSEVFIYVCELIGTAAFAISGSLIAIERKLDLFGVGLLGILTALGGGVIRDLLIGNLPPVFFYSYEYLLIAFIVSLIVFIISAKIRLKERAEKTVRIITLLFDSLGLGVFSVAGVNAAIEAGYGNNAFLVIFIGMTTAVGGGILRDVMSNATPYVLQKHIYATAAIAGSGLYYILDQALKINSEIAILSSISFVIIIRCLAAHYHWSLPKVNKK